MHDKIFQFSGKDEIKVPENKGSSPSPGGFLADLYTILGAFLIVGAVIVGSIAFSTLALQLIFPPDILDQIQAGNVPSVAVWISLIAFQVSAIALILVLARLTSPEPLRFTFALAPPQASARTIALLFVLITTVQILFSLLTSVFFPADAQHDLSVFRDIMHDAPLVLSLTALIIGAPLSEELLFRGYMMNRLSQTWLGFGGATIVSTTLWTLLHAGYSTIGLIEVFIAGLLFSWVLWQTGSLWITILFHAVYNGFVYIYLLATQPPVI